MRIFRITSLEGAAICKQVNFVDHKVQSPSEVLQKSFRNPPQVHYSSSKCDGHTDTLTFGLDHDNNIVQVECNHEDGYNLYNTNIVLDRAGTLIAKYWKQNLYFEPVFDVPAEPVFTSFTSDFGVSFGTFICFDILWEQSVQLLQQVSNTFTCQFCSDLKQTHFEFHFTAPDIKI